MEERLLDRRPDVFTCLAKLAAVDVLARFGAELCCSKRGAAKKKMQFQVRTER